MFTYTPTIGHELLSQMRRQFSSSGVDENQICDTFRTMLGSCLLAAGGLTATPESIQGKKATDLYDALRSAQMCGIFPAESRSSTNTTAIKISLSERATIRDLCVAAIETDGTRSMLAEIQALIDQGQTRRALVSVYDNVCGMLADGRLGDCDAVLSTIDTSRTEPKVLLSFLMATSQIARESLPSRKRIYESAMIQYEKLIGSDRAKKMLERYA